MVNDLKKDFEQKKRAIKHLIEIKQNNLNDKIATVKATSVVDKKRFQSAFKQLLVT